MLIIERQNAVPRWYYVVFGLVMLFTGSFGVLLTMHVHTRPKKPKK